MKGRGRRRPYIESKWGGRSRACMIIQHVPRSMCRGGLRAVARTRNIGLGFPVLELPGVDWGLALNFLGKVLITDVQSRNKGNGPSSKRSLCYCG